MNRLKCWEYIIKLLNAAQRGTQNVICVISHHWTQFRTLCQIVFLILKVPTRKHQWRAATLPDILKNNFLHGKSFQEIICSVYSRKMFELEKNNNLMKTTSRKLFFVENILCHDEIVNFSVSSEINKLITYLIIESFWGFHI